MDYTERERKDAAGVDRQSFIYLRPLPRVYCVSVGLASARYPLSRAYRRNVANQSLPSKYSGTFERTHHVDAISPHSSSVSTIRGWSGFVGGVTMYSEPSAIGHFIRIPQPLQYAVSSAGPSGDPQDEQEHPCIPP